MRICGFTCCKNETEKAKIIMSYHLNYLGFDGHLFIDNGCIDGGSSIIEGIDDRIHTFTTESSEFTQQVISNRALDLIFNDLEYDVAIPIDCDMLWVISKDRLECSIKNENYIKLPVYYMRPSYNDIDITIHNFWKKMVYLLEPNICSKIIMTKKGFNNGLFLGEGDHNIDGIPHEAVPMTWDEKLKCFEYNVLSHDDLVRKTVLNAVGRLLGYGMSWYSPEGFHHGLGTYTYDDINTLSIIGNLKNKWKEEILIYPENIVDNCKTTYNKKYQLVKNTELIDIIFDIIK